MQTVTLTSEQVNVLWSLLARVPVTPAEQYAFAAITADVNQQLQVVADNVATPGPAHFMPGPPKPKKQPAAE